MSKRMLTSVLITILVISLIAYLLFYTNISKIFEQEPKKIEYGIESLKKECLEKLEDKHNFVLALKTKDKSYCKKIVNGKEDCLERLASNKKDCEKKDEISKIFCYARIEKNPSLCDQLIELANKVCKLEATNNPEYCEESDRKEECEALIKLNETFFQSDKAKDECNKFVGG